MLSFKCIHCDYIFRVKYLLPGDEVNCQSCGGENIVPNSDKIVVSKIKNDLSIGDHTHCNFSIEQNSNAIKETTNRDFVFSKALLFFFIAIMFHIFEFRIFLTTDSINLSIVGAIFSLRAAYLLYQLDYYKRIFSIFFVICTIDIFLYACEFMNILNNNFNLRIIEVIILLVLYYKFASSFTFLHKFKSQMTILITIFTLTIFVFIISILSTPILININKLFSNNNYYLWLFNIFGIVLPVLLLNFISILLFCCVAFFMYKESKKYYK